MNVPFMDLNRIHKPLEKELMQALADSIETSRFIGGPPISNFETQFAKFCGTQFCVGTSSGTSAIALALEAMGIGPGDEVIVPANTFIATAEGVCHVGARPVFCDVDPKTFNMRADLAAKAITKQTKAILVVHLYGQVCEMDEILNLAKKNNLKVIEDAAQAHGSLYKGKRAGAFGDVATFSFYPGKNLGALGDGGAIVTNDETIAINVRVLANHGAKDNRTHEKVGYNHRLDALQALFLSTKLPHLESHNSQRQQIASQYFDALKNISDIQLLDVEIKNCNFHLFPIFVEKRDEVLSLLKEKGVGASCHYPTPCHLQSCFKELEYARGDFPNSEYCADHVLSLPIFPGMTTDEVDHVIQSLSEIF